MQLEHAPAARLLVQPVDVLRHDGGQMPLLLEPRQHAMRNVRLEAEREHFFAVKFEKFLRPPVKKAAADDRLGGIVEFLMIQAVHAAEIRDPALGGDACAAEKDGAVRLLNPAFQRFGF